MAQDPGIIQAYREGKDLYSHMASQVYNVPYEQCLEKNGPECKDRRSSVKNVLLGLLYGRQTASIAEQLGMTFKQAEQFIDNFFSTFPNIKKWIDETVRFACLTGYCETMDGVRRHLPELNSPMDFKRAEAQRQCQNSPIQGSAAGMTKRAMALVHYDQFMIDHDVKIEIPVHDELVVSCPEQYKEEVGKRLKELMVQATGVLQDYFPIKTDVEVYPTCWNDENSYKLAV